MEFTLSRPLKISKSSYRTRAAAGMAYVSRRRRGREYTFSRTLAARVFQSGEIKIIRL